MHISFLFRTEFTKEHSASYSVTLPEILIFATGSNEIPPLGFRPKPQIYFWDEARPRSNTCANILYLPLHLQKDDLSYDLFKEFMDFSILNSPTFGLA